MPKLVQIPQELRLELYRFDSEADQIVRSFVGGLETTPPPAMVYHYSDASGLRGILESGQLWLSDIFSLNDPSELRHGISYVTEMLKERAAYGTAEAKGFAEHFEHFFLTGLEKTAHYFVLSLSSNGDHLAQWRGYADNCRGYALGFDCRPLEDAFTQVGDRPIPNNSTHHVNYNDHVYKGIARQLVDRMFPLIVRPRGTGMDTPSKNEYWKALSISISLHTLRLALFFKHEGFKDEHEFRFMHIFPADAPVAGLQERMRPSGKIIKYLTFDWLKLCPDALKRVMVGPLADEDYARRIARACNLGHVDVRKSKTPYRDIR